MQLPEGRSSLQLDLHIHSGRQIKLHERVDRFIGRVDNVHQTLVGTNLHLIATGFIDMGRTQDVKTPDASRQGHRPLTMAPVRLAVSTISAADWSMSL